MLRFCVFFAGVLFLVEGRLARWAGIEQWTCDKPPNQLIQGPLKRLCRHYELWKITGRGACAGVLFLVEGAGQGALGKNWGDGIATDPQIISSRGLSDPNAFFTALLQKPYLSQVIIGPHVYPPSISQAAEETQVSSCPLDLPAHLNRPHPFVYNPVAEAPPQPGHQWAPLCTRLLFPRHRRKLK